MVLGAYLYGLETVGECMKDEKVSAFLKKCIFEELFLQLEIQKITVNLERLFWNDSLIHLSSTSC